MKSGPLVILAALLATSMPAGDPGASGQTVPAPQQTPVFRTGTSVVSVDVSVRDARRRVVTNLTAADFTVLDNGVPQTVTDVSFGKLPIDVTVGLDVSYSVTGPLLEQLRRAVLQLMRDLRKGDRLKLMLFDMRVTRTVDFTTDTRQVEQAMRTAVAGGGTALFDALSVAMISAADPDRRQLVIFFTDGHDGVSTTPLTTLTQVGERTRASVSLVLLPTYSVRGGPTSPMTPFSTVFGGRGVASNQLIVLDPGLQRLSTDTGGTVMLANTSALGVAFLRVLDDFRSAYVLHYSPSGVDRGGFHAIEVTVSRPDVVVQARRGYFGG
jgi:VWFA-related protein